MASVRKGKEQGEKSWKLEGCVERLEGEGQRKIESACAKGKGSSGREREREERVSMHFGLMANTRRV